GPVASGGAGRAGRVVAVAAAEGERGLDPVALTSRLGLELAHGLAQAQVVRMRRREIVEADAERLAALHLEDRARDLVHVDDDGVGIEDDEAVLDRLDHRFGLRLLGEDDVDARTLDRDRRLPRQRLEKLALL